MYGHADLLARLGRCTSDPTCTRPPTVQTDHGLACAAHALAEVRETVGAPA
jgi:hypothetical protein